MELIYAPKWGIEDDRVQELDHCRVELNELDSILALERKHNSESLETIEQKRKKINSLKKAISAIKKNPPKGFDALVLEDIEENVERNLAEYRHFHEDDVKNPEKNTKLAKYLAAIFGRATYTNLIAMARPKNLDHVTIHEYFKMLNDIQVSSFPPGLITGSDRFKKIKGDVHKLLNKYKEQFGLMFNDLGIIRRESDSDYMIDISPDDDTSWHTFHDVMSINVSEMPYYKKKRRGDYEFIKPMGFLVGVHENVHRLHEEISELCMPFGLRENPKASSPTCHKTPSEGVSEYSAEVALPWVTKNIAMLELNEEECKLANLYVQLATSCLIKRTLFGVLWYKHMEDDDKKGMPESAKVEARKEFVRITGDTRALTDYEYYQIMDMDEILDNMSYIFGKRRIERIAYEARKKHNIRNNDGLILQALMTGIWTSEYAQLKFVRDHYIPRAIEDGYLTRNP